MPEFWKCWNKKFSKNVTKQITLNGCNDDVVVANTFADFFSDVYYDSIVTWKHLMLTMQSLIG